MTHESKPAQKSEINALHRGFYDHHHERYGTEFTSWEEPLPNLTWSHQNIDNIKFWISIGGFPWEVEAVLKKAKNT